MKVQPTHSKLSYVYHNNNRCTERNNIELKNLEKGIGTYKGKTRELCKHCKRLNKNLR